MQLHLFHLAWFSCLVSVAGCQNSIKPGISAYDQSRYPEAIAELRRAEASVRHSDDRTQTRYALYRGLTHLALGDALAGEAWLRRVTRDTRQRARLLTRSEQGQLDAAWRSLGHMPGDR